MLSGARVVAASLLIIINININLFININIIIIFIDHRHHYYGHWCYLRPGSWQLGYSSRQTGKGVLPQCSLSTQLPSQCFLSTSLGLHKTWQPISAYAFQINRALSVSSSSSWLCQAPWAETKQNDFGKAGVLRCSEGKTDGLYFSEPRLTRQNEKILIDYSAAGLLPLSTVPSVQLLVLAVKMIETNFKHNQACKLLKELYSGNLITIVVGDAHN